MLTAGQALTAAQAIDYSAKIFKAINMTKKEWKAYKEKQKTKINSSDKAKANKAATKLKKLKEARKEKKKSKETKDNGKLEKVKKVIKTFKDLKNQEKKIVNKDIKFIKPFEGYTAKDYIRDTRHYANVSANKNNMADWMFRYNNIVAEAIKKQTERMTQYKQDQEEFYRQQKARHDQMLHNNEIARTNEFNEKININGSIMSESSYALKQMRDEEIRRSEENLETDAQIFADRLNRRDMTKQTIKEEMRRLIKDDYNVSNIRDSLNRRTSKAFRDIVNDETLSILSHADYIGLRNQEDIEYFNKVSDVLNMAVKGGVFAARTLLGLGDIPGIVDNVKAILRRAGIVEGVDDLTTILRRKLTTIKDNNEGLIKELSEKADHFRVHHREYSRLTGDPLKDVDHLKIYSMDISDLKKMSEEDIKEKG